MDYFSFNPYGRLSEVEKERRAFVLSEDYSIERLIGKTPIGNRGADTATSAPLRPSRLPSPRRLASKFSSMHLRGQVNDGPLPPTPPGYNKERFSLFALPYKPLLPPGIFDDDKDIYAMESNKASREVPVHQQRLLSEGRTLPRVPPPNLWEPQEQPNWRFTQPRRPSSSVSTGTLLSKRKLRATDPPAMPMTWSQAVRRKPALAPSVSRPLKHVSPVNESTSLSMNRPNKPNNSVKLLSDSFSFMSLGEANADLFKEVKYPVIKVSNIPWSISLAEVRELFSYVRMPNQKEVAQNIHIIINKSTGKTLANAYIEVATEKDALKALRQYRHQPVKGRKLFVTESSQDELLAEVFPEWPGKFINGDATLDVAEYNAQLAGGSNEGERARIPPPFIQRKEFEALLAVCRNYKLHFSRKCGERPFENFISMLVKYPWDKPDLITTLHRDHLYEYFKIATSVLRNHLSKTYTSLDRTLIHRMARAALQCPGFTVPQKNGVLAAGGVTCPPDLVHYLEAPEVESPSSDCFSSSSSSLNLLPNAAQFLHESPWLR